MFILCINNHAKHPDFVRQAEATLQSVCQKQFAESFSLMEFRHRQSCQTGHW